MSQKISGKSIISGMFWRFGEKITAQIISFIVSIVLARILLPEDYGVIAIVNVFIAIADIFVTSGISTSLIQKKDANQLDFSTIFYCGLALSIVLYLLVFFTAPLIAMFYKMPLLTPILRVFSLKLPISAFNSVQNAYVSRRMEFRKFFFATLIGTIISAFVGIFMALKGFGVWALVAQYLTNSFIDTLVLFIVVKWRPTFEFSFKEAKPLISYGWKILATDLVGTLFNQLNVFIIGKRFTSTDLAFYSKGKSFPDLIDTNLGGTLSAVLFPAMSQQSTNDEIIQIRRRGLKVLGYVMFPLMIGMIAVANNMVLVLLTDKWIESVFFVRITCVAVLINVFGTTLIQEIKAIGRSDITLKTELIKKSIYIVVVVASMFFGVKGVATSPLITSTVAFIVNVIPVKKHIGFDFKMHLFDLLPSLGISILMGGAVFAISFIPISHLLQLIIQIVSGILLYIALSIITKNENLFYLLNVVLKRKR